MKARVLAVAIAILLVLTTIGAVFLFKPTRATPSLDVETACGGVVDKKPGESFIVKISFKNKGTIEGTWEVAVTFEGEEWYWQGEKKAFALRQSESRILRWEGKVPDTASEGSIARLIVYYDNEFMPLKWWIHVVGYADLCIVCSNVS